uniref:E3 ubiquitin-protein ligase RBBP6 n=1 Tax=Rhabditophanes sp. KR3021 TaxID=114890 RepID=A0AC35UGM1_9BILA
MSSDEDTGRYNKKKKKTQTRMDRLYSTRYFPKSSDTCPAFSSATNASQQCGTLNRLSGSLDEENSSEMHIKNEYDSNSKINSVPEQPLRTTLNLTADKKKVPKLSTKYPLKRSANASNQPTNQDPRPLLKRHSNHSPQGPSKRASNDFPNTSNNLLSDSPRDKTDCNEGSDFIPPYPTCYPSFYPTPYNTPYPAYYPLNYPMPFQGFPLGHIHEIVNERIDSIGGNRFSNTENLSESDVILCSKCQCVVEEKPNEVEIKTEHNSDFTFM